MEKKTHARLSGGRRAGFVKTAVLLTALLLLLSACSGAMDASTATGMTTATMPVERTTGPTNAIETSSTTLAAPIASSSAASPSTGPTAAPSVTTPATTVPTTTAPTSTRPSVSIPLDDPPTSARPVIALTFDDGPSLKDTGRLLDLLKSEGVKATFFVLGNQMAAGREFLVKRAFDEGHEIANHTYSHKTLAKAGEAVVRDELERTSKMIEAIIGHRPTLMRPPTGAFDDTVKKVSGELGMAVISWSWQSTPQDWNYHGKPDIIGDHIIKTAANGHIILLHDTNTATVDAMTRVIKDLKSRGFRFMTVSELLAYQNASDPAPGTVYYQYTPRK